MIDDEDDDMMCNDEGLSGKEWINEISSGIRSYLEYAYRHRTNIVFNRQETETSKQWRRVIASVIDEHKNPKAYQSGTLDMDGARPPDCTTLLGFKFVEGIDGRRRLGLTSLFEGGNLAFAFADTPDEYRLCLDFDVNTNGYTQWFYFACKGRAGDVCKGRKVVFKIENISKPASLYNDQMTPVVWSVKEDNGWHHGCENVKTYRNEYTGRKGAEYTTLEFTYTFQHDDDVVFFAFHYPYTYSYLQTFLARLEADPYRQEWVTRSSLCSTISGLRAEMLTISDFKASDVYTDSDRCRKKRPVAFITARVHPGESNSSFMVHGFITFLTGSSPQARQLREKMIWIVVPMLNPDGVIQGNTRCNLAGVDLNRMYSNPNRYLQPTIYYLKNTMRERLAEGRQIKFFLDLHGHSKRKGIFAYGNHYTHQPELNPMLRLFPKLCSLASDDFIYSSCNFDMPAYKSGTGRVIMFREMEVVNSYTIEASFWSYDRAKIAEDKEDVADWGKHLSETAKYPVTRPRRGSVPSVKQPSGILAKRRASCISVYDFPTPPLPEDPTDVLKRRLHKISQRVGSEPNKYSLPGEVQHTARERPLTSGVFSWRRLCANGAAIGRAIVAYLGLSDPNADPTPNANVGTFYSSVHSSACICCKADATDTDVYQFHGAEACLPYLTYTRLESACVKRLVNRIAAGENRAFAPDTHSGSESDPDGELLPDKDLKKIQRRIFAKIRVLEKRHGNSEPGKKLIVAFGRSERANVSGEFYRKVMAWTSLSDGAKRPIEKFREKAETAQIRKQRKEHLGLLKSRVHYEFVDHVVQSAPEESEPSAPEEDLPLLVAQCQQDRIVLSFGVDEEELLTFSPVTPCVRRLQGKYEPSEITVPQKSHVEGIIKAFTECGRAQSTPGRCRITACMPRKTLRSPISRQREARMALKIENRLYSTPLTPKSCVDRFLVVQPSSSPTGRFSRYKSKKAATDQITACQATKNFVSNVSRQGSFSWNELDPQQDDTRIRQIGVLTADGPIFAENCTSYSFEQIPYYVHEAVEIRCNIPESHQPPNCTKYQVPPNTPVTSVTKGVCIALTDFSSMNVTGGEAADFHKLGPGGEDYEVFAPGAPNLNSHSGKAVSRIANYENPRPIEIPSILEEDANAANSVLPLHIPGRRAERSVTAPGFTEGCTAPTQPEAHAARRRSFAGVSSNADPQESVRSRAENPANKVSFFGPGDRPGADFQGKADGASQRREPYKTSNRIVRGSVSRKSDATEPALEGSSVDSLSMVGRRFERARNIGKEGNTEFIGQATDRRDSISYYSVWRKS